MWIGIGFTHVGAINFYTSNKQFCYAIWQHVAIKSTFLNYKFLTFYTLKGV